MRKIEIPAVVIALSIAMALPAWSEDLAAIKQALEAKYALTTTTADKTDIVTPGCVLVLKKDRLVTVDVKSKNLYQNTYKNGEITQNPLGKTTVWLRKRIPGASSASGSDREFVSGEKLWVTGIDVKEDGVVFTLFTDAYSDVRYEASLTFPFHKYAPRTLSEATELVGEVFDIQPSDDPKTPQQASTGKGKPQPAPASPRPVSTSPAPPTGGEAPPPPIAPPPPAPADPKTISTGQSPEQVTAILGAPVKVVKLGSKQIYYYKDMKVIFVNDKVTDVQ